MLDSTFLCSGQISGTLDSGEQTKYQSSFQILYEKKKKELMMTRSELDDYLNLDDNSSEDSDTNESIFSDYTDLVAKTLNMPLSQVYYQAKTNPIGILINKQQNKAFTKLIEKSKRLMRRNKAKERQKNKIFESEILGHNSLTSEESCQPSKQLKTSDGVGKKKTDIDSNLEPSQRQIQMMRNRISAQNSRDRKKNYIKKLQQNQNQLQKENQMLKEKIININAELENSYVQINNLRMQQSEQNGNYFTPQQWMCLDCKSINIVDQQEQLEQFEQELSPVFSRLPSFSKLSLGLFTIFAIFAILSSSNLYQNTNTSTILYQLPDRSLKNMTVIQETYKKSQILSQENEDWPILHKILELRQDVPNKQIVEFESFQPQRKDQDKFLSVSTVKKDYNLQNQLATLGYYDQGVSSIYCPNSFVYQDFSQGGVQVMFKDSQWVHLLVPRQNITMFYENWQDENIYTEKNTSHPHKTFTEIWCQVKSVIDISIE